LASAECDGRCLVDDDERADSEIVEDRRPFRQQVRGEEIDRRGRAADLHAIEHPAPFVTHLVAQ
jgi:hypothetical protein